MQQVKYTSCLLPFYIGRCPAVSSAKNWQKKKPTNTQHPWVLLKDCLKNHSRHYLMRLTECKAVINAKGGYFKESKI